MASLVYYKFKANVKMDSVPFDGSAISVKDLKSAIRAKCCLHSGDFDLKLEDTSGKSYNKDDELIPKYTSIIVRRVPRLTADVQKKKSLTEDALWRELQRNQSAATDSQTLNVNLADSDLPEEEKIKIMMERSSEAYSEKNYTVKAKPYGVPPAAYVCHKCNLPGHWIHNCPGVRDKTGKMMDVKSIKRPTGIPQDFLLEVDAGTPGAYLGKSGKYMVPIKDAEAYAQGKKDKRPFSLEENPPYVPPQERKPPKQYICPLCQEMFKDAVLVSCCGTTYCNECIMGHVFDSQILGSRKCPNCAATLTDHESSVFENALVRSMIRDWLANEIGLASIETLSQPLDIPSLPEPVRAFINNRRVLKPKQLTSSSIFPQVKSEEAVVSNPHEHSISPKSERTSKSPAPISEVMQSDAFQANAAVDNQSLFLQSDNLPLNSSPVTSLSTTDSSVVCNTSAAAVASAPCTTSGANRQSLLAVSALTTASLSCIRYNSPATSLPTVLPSLANSSNLIGTLYGVRMANFQPPVITDQTLLSTAALQPPIVGGSEWATGPTIIAPTAPAGGVMESIFPPSSTQLAYSLVPTQAAAIHGGALTTALPHTGQTIDGRKFLSKEEFYRLKMEMLHSARRRHRHHRSRSPHHSTSHRSSHGNDISRSRRTYDKDSMDRSSRYRSSADDYESSRRRHHRNLEEYYESRYGRDPYRRRLDVPFIIEDSDHSRERVYSRRCRERPIDERLSRVKMERHRHGSNSPIPYSREQIVEFEVPRDTSKRYYGSDPSVLRSKGFDAASVVPQYDISDTDSVEGRKNVEVKSIEEPKKKHKHKKRHRKEVDLAASVEMPQVSAALPNLNEQSNDADHMNAAPIDTEGELKQRKKSKKEKKEKKARRHKHKRRLENSAQVLRTSTENVETTLPDETTTTPRISITSGVSDLVVKKHKHKKHKHVHKHSKQPANSSLPGETLFVPAAEQSL